MILPLRKMLEERRGHVNAFQILCLGAAATGVEDRVSARWPHGCRLLRRILLDAIEHTAPLAAAGRSELLLLAAAGRSELLLLALLAAGW